MLLSNNRERINAGLLLSLLGNLASLPFSRRYHILLGSCLAMLSLFHTWQHRHHFSGMLKKEQETMGWLTKYKNSLQTSRHSQFLQSLQVQHYLPGRIRLYSKHLLNNQSVAAELNRLLTAVPELTGFSVSTATGSILLQYTPEAVVGSSFLQELEQFALAHYRR
ncbi:HMA2 domain-containing protein [Propionispora hippei]|uniref:Uncharacterized protein n=1 Tax=Propionispora hippei DSM 15287 TaxID=1123003 RepID=A0A1M6M3J4_9FIRM|nr:hypothetical protein [Propionispora hippei]SHJ78012.1 hypothetical protein SAMN02745170_03302 [Propionispora hippei DSM 15287]